MSVIEVSDLDYTDHGTVTAVPASTISNVKAINVYWMDTTAGNIDVSMNLPANKPSSVGLLPGQHIIFRKHTADTNKLLWSGTVNGVSTSYEILARFQVTREQFDLMATTSDTWILY